MKIYIVKSELYPFEVSFEDRGQALREFYRLFERFEDAAIGTREIGRQSFNAEARREFEEYRARAKQKMLDS